MSFGKNSLRHQDYDTALDQEESMALLRFEVEERKGSDCRLKV
jgi:hypothetical protein